MRHKPQMFGQAYATLVSYLEEEFPYPSGAPVTGMGLQKSCPLVSASLNKLKTGAQGHCNSQTCRVVIDTSNGVIS